MSAPPNYRAAPVALVTGGARRVGRAICLALSRAGVEVHFSFLKSDEESRLLLEDLCTNTPGSCAHKLDLRDVCAVGEFAGAWAASGRACDILVHNASIYAPAAISEITPELYERFQRINALSPLLLTKHLAPKLRRSSLPGGGAVVAMCDIHAMGLPRARFGAYSMSKAALVEMVRTLAIELAPEVRVNGVAPGVVAWPEEGYESDAAAQRAYLERVPLERAGTPEDAAETVRWLALEARYTTGQMIRVDGGRSLR
ncbi:MAG: SDR family oxidoreductase [Phycisphaeraceae bacterium]|nr:SDR family oxidoreductase [Phycisphaerales bacterium]MCB9842573.1 SDR family oxidoreductase [Phycisphaeraceae bacterium]